MQGYTHLYGYKKDVADVKNALVDGVADVVCEDRRSLFCCTTVNCIAAAEAIPVAVVERALVLVGCAAFVVSSGIKVILGSKHTEDKVNEGLIILGSCCYAAAVSAAWCLQNQGPRRLNWATVPLLTVTLWSFLSFGVMQYNEGGSESILSATVLFSAAILARVAHNALKSVASNNEVNNNIEENAAARTTEKDSQGLLFTLLAHYIFAIAGSVIFLYDNVKEENTNPSLENPALASAIGAASFLAAKGLGFSLTVRDIIKWWKSNPEAMNLLDESGTNA